LARASSKVARVEPVVSAVSRAQPGGGSQVRQSERLTVLAVRDVDADPFEIGEHLLPATNSGTADEHFGQVQRVDEESLVCRCAKVLGCRLVVPVVRVQVRDHHAGLKCDHSGQSRRSSAR
jgi:hypothetical protein